MMIASNARWQGFLRYTALVLAAITLLAGLLIAAARADELATPAEGVSFDGQATYAVVDEGDAFDLDAFTLATWVNLRHTRGSQVFLNRGTAGGLFTLYLFGDRVRMLVEYADGQYTHANTAAPPADTWAHYLGTYDGEEIRLFVNGELVATPRAPGRIPASNARLRLGALEPDTRILDGQLEDVRIWNRALPAEQTARIATGCSDPTLAEGRIAQ